MLYESGGHANGGESMEQPPGILAAQLVRPAPGGGNIIGGWRMREVDGVSKRPEIQADFDDNDWKNVAVDNVEANQLSAGKMAVFRTRIEIADAGFKNAKWDLRFGRIDNAGWIYVNGKSVGKTTDWSRAYSFDVTKQLHSGTNVIAVVVQNADGAGGLGAPTLGRQFEGASVPLKSFGSPAGIEGQWWESDFKDKRWETVVIGSDSSATDGLLAWYRMNFQLPSSKPGIWVPWRLHLNADGNGFLYLNGHAIGRYWQSWTTT